MLPTIHSIKQIERQLNTGEEPVLVMCSDVNTYICKYMRSSAASYKLACEFIGARLASEWQLNTPYIALVNIKAAHWTGINLSHSVSAPSLGNRWLVGVVDITPSTFAKVPANIDTLKQLLKIALFDFWIANEDRNANNANLMYDVDHERLVSIDYGCIFNTATFDYPLSQLTSTDTILWSDLFKHLAQHQTMTTILPLIDDMRNEYKTILQQCEHLTQEIVNGIPLEWNIPKTTVSAKLSQLFDKKWTDGVWDNFIENLNDNINHE